MVPFLVTCDLNYPQTIPFLIFCIAFGIFVVGGVWYKVDSSKCKPADKIDYHGNVPWAIIKRGLDRQFTVKYLPYYENLVEIGIVDPEFYLLRCLFKKKKNKLRQAKSVAKLFLQQ